MYKNLLMEGMVGELNYKVVGICNVFLPSDGPKNGVLSLVQGLIDQNFIKKRVNFNFFIILSSQKLFIYNSINIISICLCELSFSFTSFHSDAQIIYLASRGLTNCHLLMEGFFGFLLKSVRNISCDKIKLCYKKFENEMIRKFKVGI